MKSKAFDLPINEVKGYVYDLMEQIGENVTVDGVQTKIMLAELERVYTNMQQNIKRAVFLYDTEFSKGSVIEFDNEKTAIVCSVPNDDIVSKSAEILNCNSKPVIFRYEEVFDTDPKSPTYGDRLNKGLVLKGEVYGFIERLSAREKRYDVGLLHNAILRFVTVETSGIVLDDIVKYKNKQYRVIDIDDITEGVSVVQLATIRDYYEQDK